MVRLQMFVKEMFVKEGDTFIIQLMAVIQLLHSALNGSALLQCGHKDNDDDNGDPDDDNNNQDDNHDELNQ